MEKKKVEAILKDLHVHDYRFILDKYQITRGELLGILNSSLATGLLSIRLRNKHYSIVEEGLLKKIPGKRFGLISDTHIGNKKARWDYIQMAYDFFDSHHADAVLHLGDLFDGYHDAYCGGIHEDKMAFLERQLKEFEDNFPTKLPTYLLLGNHDEWFRKYKFDLCSLLPCLNSNVIVLDYGGYLISLGGLPFYLSHPITNIYCISNPGYITLRGHSHYFEYHQKNNVFRLNTCSDANPNSSDGNYGLVGGFAFLSFSNKMMCFETYLFYHDDIVKSLTLKR